MFAADGYLNALLARTRATSILSVYMLGVYAVVALVGVVAIRVLTGLAAPAVFGEANLLLMSLQLAVNVVSQPITNTQIRYHSAEVDAGRGDGFTRAILFWTCAASSAISLIGALSWLVMRHIHPTSLGADGVGGMALLIFATSIRSVTFGRLQAERRNFVYGGLLAIEACMAAAGAAIGLWISPTVDGYVVGQAVGASGAAMLGLTVDARATMRVLFGPQRAPNVLSQVRAYGLPFAPMGILNWLTNSADRYALGFLAGPAAVGQYVAPFAIASRAMTLLGGAMADIFRPMLFQSANRNDKQGARRIFWIWMAARALTVVGAVLALMLFGPLIARLILAPAYRSGATPILMWVSAGYGVQGMIQTIESRLMSLDRTSWLIAPLAIGGVANLAFSFLLIPHFGIIGAGMATTASFIVQGGVTVWWLRQAERSAGA